MRLWWKVVKNFFFIANFIMNQGGLKFFIIIRMMMCLCVYIYEMSIIKKKHSAREFCSKWAIKNKRNIFIVNPVVCFSYYYIIIISYSNTLIQSLIDFKYFYSLFQKSTQTCSMMFILSTCPASVCSFTDTHQEVYNSNFHKLKNMETWELHTKNDPPLIKRSRIDNQVFTVVACYM